MFLQIHKLSQENAIQALHQQPHMFGHILKDRAFCQELFVMTFIIKKQKMCDFTQGIIFYLLHHQQPPKDIRIHKTVIIPKSDRSNDATGLQS